MFVSHLKFKLLLLLLLLLLLHFFVANFTLLVNVFFAHLPLHLDSLLCSLASQHRLNLLLTVSELSEGGGNIFVTFLHPCGIFL